MSTDRQAEEVDLYSALIRVLPPARMATYLTAAKNDSQLAARLYLWNRDLSVAILGDIALLEVALRTAMHDAACTTWGPQWYQVVALDDRSCGQLATAWSHLPNAVTKQPDDPAAPGRLVAQCMFGFWTNLLDKGGYTGREPRRLDVSYEELWLKAFRAAFPGGRLEAKAIRHASGEVEPTFTREWVHSVCKIVNELRNRVAHHEALINGFPMKGQQGVRYTAAEGYAHLELLARMIDRDFASWLAVNSSVHALLGSRPESTVVNQDLPAPTPM
ncbi:hypothetical protein [Luteococcus sanguinis]|uniref:Abi-like protein n=1 Tax=Luteococcus sanguinis TaxID=174038 RepID=A0ABW1X231_9ACTN